ncbi:MAG: hypothetical protein ACO225_10630 [Ilumatobacteraceae bacterium]
MPWCEECSKYLTPSSLRTDGTCPTCGRSVGESERRAELEMSDETAPWHFKLLVVLLVVYLGWRFVEVFT